MAGHFLKDLNAGKSDSSRRPRANRNSGTATPPDASLANLTAEAVAALPPPGMLVLLFSRCCSVDVAQRVTTHHLLLVPRSIWPHLLGLFSETRQ